MKAVPGWEGYFCDQMGNVYSTKHKRVRLMKHKPGSRGYSKIQLQDPEREWTTHVHRIMAITWLGPAEEGMEVNHKNGVKTDNRLENLEWATHLQNERHSRTVLGKDMRGTKHKLAKLTDESVSEIRALRSTGATYQSLADKFGIAVSHAKRVADGDVWKHV